MVHTHARAVYLPQSMGHASLVAHERSEVDRLAGVILRPGAHLTPVFTATLTGQEPHVSMTRGMEFTMRLSEKKKKTYYIVLVFIT